jgi:hypothetical protein
MPDNHTKIFRFQKDSEKKGGHFGFCWVCVCGGLVACLGTDPNEVNSIPFNPDFIK